MPGEKLIYEKGNKIKNIQGNRRPDYDLFNRYKGRNRKPRQMLEANKKKVLWKIVGKTKVNRINSQQIRESCGIQSVNEWKEEEEDGTNM